MFQVDLRLSHYFPMPAPDPLPDPPTLADTPTAPGLATFFVIEFDPELGKAAYTVASAPNEIKAREAADLAARSSGRILIDVLTPAMLATWLERAQIHPPELVAPA